MIYFVRLAGVAWVGILSFLFALFVSRVLDHLTPEYDETKPKYRTLLEVCFQFGLIAVIVYLSRNLIKKVPFPLEGVAGYIHSDLGELRSLPLMVFIFMFFQTKTQNKMRALDY